MENDIRPSESSIPVLGYSAPSDGKLVVVARFNDYLEAELARNALDAEGIRCMVGGLDLTAITGYGPMRSAQISVSEEDVPAARAVLDRIAQRRAQRVARMTRVACPACGQAPAQRGGTRLVVGFVGVAVGIMLLLFVGPAAALIPLAVGLYALFSLGSSPYRCAVCGHCWTAREDDPCQDDDPGSRESDVGGTDRQDGC